MSTETGVQRTFVTLGASNHSDTERESNDYYATDPKAVELLLALEVFSHDIWEPACGEGHISKVLERHRHAVRSTDLIDRGFGRGGVDFLSETGTYNGDIVTNPPYKYAKEFVEHAIETVPNGNKVAMLLRLSFLEGKSRRELFDRCPPKTVYVSSGRINCCKNGDFSHEQRSSNSAQAYAWFVWQKGYAGPTVVKWFN